MNNKQFLLCKKLFGRINHHHSVPIINLSNYNPSNQEKQQLKLGFDYCFVDKNKDIRRFLAANMESLANNVNGNIDHKNLEYFHKYFTYVAIQIFLQITFMLQKIILIITSVV